MKDKINKNEVAVCKIELGIQYQCLKQARDTLYKIANEQYRNGNITISAAISGQVSDLMRIEASLKAIVEGK